MKFRYVESTFSLSVVPNTFSLLMNFNDYPKLGMNSIKFSSPVTLSTEASLSLGQRLFKARLPASSEISDSNTGNSLPNRPNPKKDREFFKFKPPQHCLSLMENESFEIVQDSSYFKDNSFLSPPNEALRIQENEIQKLKKLNFNLKLRICQLEEQLGLELTGNEDVNCTRRHSAYSDSEEKDSPYPSRTSILKELEEEIYRRDILLTKARTVILSLQKQLSHQDKRCKNDKTSGCQQMSDSSKSFEADAQKSKENLIIPQLEEISQRILAKLQGQQWDSCQVENVQTNANLNNVLKNLTLIEEKMDRLCETPCDTKETSNSVVAKIGSSLRGSLSTSYETDKENVKSPNCENQQHSIVQVFRSSSPFLKQNDSMEKYQHQPMLERLLDSIRELGELTFECEKLLDKEDQITPLPSLPPEGTPCSTSEYLQNAVSYVTYLQRYLSDIRTKLQLNSSGLCPRTKQMMERLVTLEDSMKNSDTTPVKAGVHFNFCMPKTPQSCQKSCSEINFQKPDVSYSDKSCTATIFDIASSETSKFHAQWKVDEENTFLSTLKELTQFSESAYIEKLQKILIEMETLNRKVQQTQKKMTRIQQQRSVPLAFDTSLFNSLSNKELASYKHGSEEESSSDSTDNLNVVTMYQESFSNLVSFVSGAFTIFEEIDFDQQLAIPKEASFITTALNRLFTWGQSTLAPSPFSPGSSREKEYVLTTWSKEKTAYEGLDLLRKTVEQIAQYKDYEKNQVNQNLKITRACEKSLAALDNFVQHLAQKVAAKQTLSIQRLGELERRLNAFKNRRNISSSAKSSEVSLLLSTETKPRSLSGKLSNHKALKKWVLEQISETQRTIQQTQKSLDNERKHLLYNWLSTSK